MTVDSIRNGIVIDHIENGLAMKIYQIMHLDRLDCPVAILENVTSKKQGKKDILKIDGHIPTNLDIVGIVAPNATINIVRDAKVVKKVKPELPAKTTGIFTCKNPRCITSVEQGIKQTFRLADKEKGEYRCIYCDTKVNLDIE